MISAFWAIVAFFLGLAALVIGRKSDLEFFKPVGLFMLPLSAALFVLSMIVTVAPGHVGVPVWFGEVDAEERTEGMHFENPFLTWQMYDCRQKTHKETMGVPLGAATSTPKWGRRGLPFRMRWLP